MLWQEVGVYMKTLYLDAAGGIEKGLYSPGKVGLRKYCNDISVGSCIFQWSRLCQDSSIALRRNLREHGNAARELVREGSALRHPGRDRPISCMRSAITARKGRIAIAVRCF